MDKIYIVIWIDRHSDTKAYPFMHKEKAISEAQRIAKECCKNEVCYEERTYENDKDGWIFFVEYSSEDDCLIVIESKIDEDIE